MSSQGQSRMCYQITTNTKTSFSTKAITNAFFLWMSQLRFTSLTWLRRFNWLASSVQQTVAVRHYRSYWQSLEGQKFYWTQTLTVREVKLDDNETLLKHLNRKDDSNYSAQL